MDICKQLFQREGQVGDTRTIITYCPRRNYYWINSEEGSSNFQDLFTEINLFQTDSSNLSCKGSKVWKLLETIINSKQDPSRKKNQ